MSNEFKIGTTLLGMTLLSSLNGNLPMPDAGFSLFTSSSDLAYGHKRGLGKSIAEWHWEAVSFDQRNSLKACCPGLSADIFIRTLDEENQYANFSGIMIWPELEDIDANGSVLDFTIQFKQLVKQ